MTPRGPALSRDPAATARILAASLGQLDDWYLSGFLIEAARGLDRLERRLRRGALPGRGFEPARSGRLDPWSVPDGAWLAMVRRRPALACYPLGEIVERAVKKAVVEQLIGAGLRPGRRRRPSARAAATTLARGLGRPRERRLLRRFLAHFLFELCIDLIRREDRHSEPEPAYLYHFTIDGRFRSLAEERSWRRWLTGTCAAWAERLLPHLLAALPETDFGAVREAVRAGFREIGGRVPRHPGRGLPDPVFRVVASDRLEDALERGDPEDPRVTLLVLNRVGGNVSVGCDWLRGGPGSAIEDGIAPLVRDLVEIGAAVYMAGVVVSRQRHLGRRLDFELRVRCPKRWSAVARRIERVASILTRDDLTLSFEPRGTPGTAPHSRLARRRTDRPVCLFSGGLDSLAGAVRLLEAGERPILLSHYANSSLAALQKHLVGRLRAIYGSDRLDHLGVYVAPSGAPSNPLPLRPRRRQPMARFLRPFMLLSLACSAALHFGSRRVLICESGPLAIYPLFNEGQIRTRSVDPRFVGGFQRLIRRVSRTRLRIDNPLLYMTKGEALEAFADPRLSGLLADSNSCWHWAQLRAVAKRRGVDAAGATHDGSCLPCLVRRAAVHAAGLWEADAGYVADIFTDFGELDREAVLTVADYFRFCENLRTLPSAEGLLLAPDFSVCAPGVDCDRLLRMFRRSARELRSVLVARGGRELRRALGLTAAGRGR